MGEWSLLRCRLCCRGQRCCSPQWPSWARLSSTVRSPALSIRGCRRVLEYTRTLELQLCTQLSRTHQRPRTHRNRLSLSSSQIRHLSSGSPCVCDSIPSSATASALSHCPHATASVALLLTRRWTPRLHASRLLPSPISPLPFPLRHGRRAGQAARCVLLVQDGDRAGGAGELGQDDLRQLPQRRPPPRRGSHRRHERQSHEEGRSHSQGPPLTPPSPPPPLSSLCIR